jgi:serine/threonine protein kinase
MDDPSKYRLEELRDDGEFILSRVVSRGDSPPTLVLAPASDQPDLASLKRLDHEFSLRDQLDPAWAVRPLAFSEQRGRTMLVMEDPGGKTLDRFLPGPMQMPQFLRFAVGLATALGGLHKRDLIHKDVKPPVFWLIPRRVRSASWVRDGFAPDRLLIPGKL